MRYRSTTLFGEEPRFVSGSPIGPDEIGMQGSSAAVRCWGLLARVHQRAFLLEPSAVARHGVRSRLCGIPAIPSSQIRDRRAGRLVSRANAYVLSTRLHGIRRRSAASASRARVRAFSFTRSSSRAVSHS